jgi:catechol 2,3-dioxygenase-like lactoylglutathione lyase family enzyme
MTVSLNHTIVHAHDKQASAQFLVDILGLRPPTPYGPFLVGDTEFDGIRDRIVARGLTYWADPFHRRSGQVNTDDGGRGLYWQDPNGHSLEIITVPYGG